MKTTKMHNVHIVFIFGFLWISLSGNSQNTKPTRQEVKEAKKAQMVENFYLLDSLLKSGSFVLEADYLRNKYGEMVNVSSTLNFIRVDKSKGVLQTGSNFSTGYNGVGGVTAEGNIDGLKVTKDSKRLTFSVRFNIITNIGVYDIFMTVNATNNASATISGTTSGKLTWSGHLKSIDNSRVFKGYNTI